MLLNLPRTALLTLCAIALLGCGGSGSLGGLGSSGLGAENTKPTNPSNNRRFNRVTGEFESTTGKNSTIWDLFDSPDPNVNIRVNKYLWKASLDTLSFLPLEGADPFSGIIVMGWGHAQGSGQTYRATVYIQDPALDARSLKVSVQRRSGGGSVPASKETVRKIEDAILTRARQLRVAEEKL